MDLFGTNDGNLNQYNLPVTAKERPLMTDNNIYSVTMTKGYEGHTAKSEVSLGMTPEGERILKLSTSKSRNGIGSCASVVVRTADSETCIIFQDYMKWFNQTPCGRVTAAAVKEAHLQTLKLMPTILAEVRAQYKTEDSTNV